MKFRVYRYDPDKDARPYVQDYDVALDVHDHMLLDALIKLQERVQNERGDRTLPQRHGSGRMLEDSQKPKAES